MCVGSRSSRNDVWRVVETARAIYKYSLNTRWPWIPSSITISGRARCWNRTRNLCVCVWLELVEFSENIYKYTANPRTHTSAPHVFSSQYQRKPRREKEINKTRMITKKLAARVSANGIELNVFHFSTKHVSISTTARHPSPTPNTHTHTPPHICIHETSIVLYSV